MNDQEKEKQFIDNVKKALDLDAQKLDAGTQSKLNRIRQKALDAGERKSFDIRRWFTLPVAGWAATACLIVLGLTLYMKPSNGTLPPLEDIDLLAAEDNLEFYDSLEFYAWLAEEEVDAAG
ncbi:MAG: hypothetical protein OEZ51_04580 [Nitrospinota bacterium]|nr:hypothetical protein [Nitrospinota bacterium]